MVSIDGAPYAYSASCNVHCDMFEEHLLLKHVLLTHLPSWKSYADSVICRGSRDNLKNQARDEGGDEETRKVKRDK